MRPMVVAGLLAALAAGGALAAGQESQINWTVYGQATAACKEWTAARQQAGAAEAPFRAWVGGFMSAARYYHTLLAGTLAPLPEVNFDDQLKWIDSRCADNPDEMLAVAARALLTDLAAKGRREPPQPRTQGGRERGR